MFKTESFKLLTKYNVKKPNLLKIDEMLCRTIMLQK